MIRRYSGPKMRSIWDGSLAKFTKWLRVELAVMEVREKLGQIPPGTTDRVREATWIDEHVVENIDQRDKEIGHDLNAFVEIMRCQIILGKVQYLTYTAMPEYFNENIGRALEQITGSADAGWFHDGMTSYDTEEPAMALLFESACGVIDAQLEILLGLLEQKAVEYRGVVMIGRTHGQHAQPITFGVKFLNWLDLARRAREQFAIAANNARVMKLSGAVGMYGTIGPQVEEEVGRLLKLKPVIATQIVSLDYRARVVTELAFIADVVEKIADDLWHMCQTEVGEVREPFSKRQKGSSAMPHKKNPIKLENVRGFAAVVRAYAHVMMELVKTSHERDISHSGPERIVVPDAFGLLDHQLRTIISIVGDLEVFKDRMCDNIGLSCGTFASQKIEMILKREGMAAETAYRTVQRLCGEAVQKRRYLRDLMLEDPNEELATILDGILAEFKACFNPETWIQEEAAIYNRMNVAA